MKKTAWLLTLLVSLATADGYAQQTNRMYYSEELGLRVGIIDDVEPTEEEKFRRKMNEALPYGRGNDMSFYYERRTLGQLTKLCDHIVVGTVTRLTILPDDKNVPEWRINRFVSLKISVESVIYGSVPRKNLTINVYWPPDDAIFLRICGKRDTWNWKVRPKVGDKLLLFLANTEIEDYFGVYEFAFNLTLERVKNSGKYYLLRQNGGVRYLDTPENATNYLTSTKGYLRELRGEKRNFNCYYSFLADLVQSPVQSIREDARSNLIFLYHSCPPLDKKQILADERIDEAIKFWLNTKPFQKEFN